MILSVFFGKETSNAILLNHGRLAGYIECADNTALDKFVSENRSSINKAVVLLSDHYNEYFLHAFDNAAEEDIEKAVAYRTKDLIAHPLNKSAFAIQTVKQSGSNSLSSISAVSPLPAVKKMEELMARHGITQYSVAPASLFLLNLRAETDFVQLLTSDDITTFVFVFGNSIKYIRKTPSEAGLNETIKFYNEKYREFPVKDIFSIGRELEKIQDIPVKNITAKELLHTDLKEASGLEAAIGAALCV